MRTSSRGASNLIPPRDELVRQAMSLWSVHGASWATNLATYEALLEMKLEKNIYPLRQIKKVELATYPKIDFMEIRSEDKAREYLLTLSVGQIFELIGDIETAINSYIYITVRNKIADYRAELKRHEHGINLYAVDPDIRFSSRKCKMGKHGTANAEE